MNFIASLFGPYVYEAFSLSITFFNYQICIFLFARDLKKKNHFILRTLLSLVIGVFLCYLLAILNTTFDVLWVRVICYLAVTFINLGVIFFCYGASVESMLLAFCTGSAANQIAGKLYPLIQNVFGIDDRATISLVHAASQPIQNWEWFLYFLLQYAIVFLLSIPFRPKGKPVHEKKVTRSIVALSIATILNVDILICIARTYEAESFAMNVLLKIFCIGFGFGILPACSNILSQNEKDQQIVILKQLWKQDMAQFESVKANMDVINMKCHDLRHIFSRIEGKLTENEISSLQEAIQFYDANIKTGNEVLDVVLCEKAMLCQKNNIHFSCMVDGKKLTFLTPVQSYTLFGNMIDNAVEAVQKLSDPENKVISIVCQENNGYLDIEESNYFSGELLLDGNLPATVKDDSSRHGFGIKSIKYIAEQYGGQISVKVEENMFFLNVHFPVASDTK